MSENATPRPDEQVVLVMLSEHDRLLRIEEAARAVIAIREPMITGFVPTLLDKALTALREALETPR